MLHMVCNTKLFLIVLACIITVTHAEYYCWDQADRANLTFKNNPYKQMDYLPTIRLIQGYYSSQFALQYLAFVYLKEKMGVNVKFYPDDNPNALFDRYAGYQYWCQDKRDENCSEYAPYPQFYFEDIKNDEYDLLFEIWSVMESTGKGQQYYDEKTVAFGGISGAYAESSWYIPQYVYDETPQWMAPKELKENQSVRTKFIDAYTVDSETNWIKEWYTINSDTLNTYDSSKFDLPTNTTPIVWGSSRGYAISDYSSKLIGNVLDGGMDWHFVPFGSEEMLTQFVTEMYRNQLPFIANLYSPHLDFSTFVNETESNEYMKFQRIGLPRNPNNDINDQCYIDSRCAFPLTPLLKIVNPKIQNTFPEMYEFLLDFRIATTDLNDIIAYYEDVSTAPDVIGLSDHELWYETACMWLKNNEATTNHWHKEIIRYDCITNEWQNCGFLYYFESFKDSLNGVKKLKLSPYESIGGYCMNSTIGSQCSCPYDEFQGSNCQQSCPFIGPIPDSAIMDTELDTYDILNKSRLSIDNYTLFFCHGHGTCDIKHKHCQCMDGYAGDECEIKFKIFKYDAALIVIWIILFFVLLIILILSIIWMWKHKQYKSINALSVKMSTWFTVGLMLLCIGAVLYLFHPMNDVLCIVYFYTYGVGAMLTVMSPLCKTARVAIIFAQARQLKQIKIPDAKLLMYLSAAVVIETLICVLYAVLHQLNGGVEIVYHEEYHRTEYVCNASDNVQYVRIGNYIFINLFLIILCYFGFQNRNTWKIFKEERCIYFSSFFSLFVFVMLIIFNVVTNDIWVAITTQSGGVFIVITTIWILFYGVRMYNFYKHPDKRKRKAEGNGRRSSATSEVTSDVPSYIHKLQKERGPHSATITGTSTELGIIQEETSPS